MARAHPEHGELLACDVDERMMEVAREFFGRRRGRLTRFRNTWRPRRSVEKLVGDEHQLEQYGLAFIDANKRVRPAATLRHK